MLWLFFVAPLCGIVLSSPQSGDVNQVGSVGDAINKDQIDTLSSLLTTFGKDMKAGHQCGDPNSYACVPYFQCEDGEIITDGGGQIDLRLGQEGTTQPPGNCLNSEYPELPAQCCHIPGTPVVPIPIEVCDGGQECVENDLCSADSTINTDGTGFIDIRSGQVSCWINKIDIGVCCSPPVDPPLLFCPESSTCVDEFLCFGKALTDSISNTFIEYGSDGVWESCELEGGISPIGICCEPYPVLDTCPENSQCVIRENCLGNALDRNQAFNPYEPSGSWSDCWLPDQTKGVCCQPPYVIDQCPEGGKCLVAEVCKGNAIDYNNVYSPYNEASLFMPCNLQGANYDGICCVNDFGPPAQQCGVSNPKIDTRIISNSPLEDYETGFAEFPWQAIIFGEGYSFVCGATLISNIFLLTAAHCVDKGVLPSSLRVRLGEWQVNSFDEDLPYVDIEVANIIIHSEYVAANVHNDIAVLELIEPVTFDYHINSLCVPASGNLPHPYTRCVATGWGKDSFATGNYQHILKKVELPFIPYEECQGLLRKTRLSRFFKLHKSFVCAGGEENRDVCEGDGGGPLACYNDALGIYELIGITAWGIGCGEKDIPGVYVNVPYFTNWINEVTSSANQKF